MNKRLFIKTVLVGIFALPVALYGSVLAYFIHAEPSLVYMPKRGALPLEQQIQGRAERVVMRAADGTRLVGWVFPAKLPTRYWVYFMHGNAGNATTCQAWWNLAHELGANFFVLDYRGFGESAGTPSESGLYQDALVGYEFLVSQRSALPEEIIIYGHSLGSAVAIDLATRVRAAGLIVEGAMISIPERGEELYPFLPLNIIAHNRFESLKKIDSVLCPVLFLHARDDRTIPIRHGRVLYARAREPKTFIELKGDHITAIETDRKEVLSAINRFAKEIGWKLRGDANSMDRPAFYSQTGQ